MKHLDQMAEQFLQQGHAQEDMHVELSALLHKVWSAACVRRRRRGSGVISKLTRVLAAEPDLKYTEGELADHIGASRSYVSTLLADWKRRGWLQGGMHGRIRVLRPAELRKLAKEVE